MSKRFVGIRFVAIQAFWAALRLHCRQSDETSEIAVRAELDSSLDQMTDGQAATIEAACMHLALSLRARREARERAADTDFEPLHPTLEATIDLVEQNRRQTTKKCGGCPLAFRCRRAGEGILHALEKRKCGATPTSSGQPDRSDDAAAAPADARGGVHPTLRAMMEIRALNE